MLEEDWMSSGSIKRRLRENLERFFRLFNVDLFIRFSRSEKYSRILIDRYTLEYFFEPSPERELYHEGMVRSASQENDNFFRQLRFQTLQQMARHVLDKELDGDFAECGCLQGHSTYIVSQLIQDHSRSDRLFHVFDSFEGGLSDKIATDTNTRNALTDEQVQAEKQSFASMESQVAAVVSPFTFVRLYKGWIPERFDAVENSRFAFVHIDVDLYEPTLDSLEFFFPRLVEGGCMVIDD